MNRGYNVNRNSYRTRNRIAVGIFSLLFAVCAVWLISYVVQNRKTQKSFEKLKDSYMRETGIAESLSKTAKYVFNEEIAKAGDNIQDPKELPGLEGYDVPDRLIDIQALKQEVNKDIYAWLTIPDTAIDYPVLQHPEEADYYLDHNLDGSKGRPGCIYTQLYNSKNWDDENTVLYGHNMSNGTMFAPLHQYRDPVFFEENPYIYIYTEDKIRLYKIFAAYEYSDMNLVIGYRLAGQESYEEYLAGIYELDGMNNNFDKDITVTSEDRIITLETCITNKPQMRYLVQGVLSAEEEIYKESAR